MSPQQHVAVDWEPKLHGLWDIMNSALATAGPTTRLRNFYICKARSIVDRIVTKEGYSGFNDCGVSDCWYWRTAGRGRAVHGFQLWGKETQGFIPRRLRYER